jgi:tripartite-type tricarboxylate transporter receptor subunit TctC
MMKGTSDWLRTVLRRRLAWLAVAAALAIFAPLRPAAVWADDFPSRPVSIIVAYPAGSSNDTLARQLAAEMTSLLGRNVIVINAGGVGGIIGTDQVAKAAPDGYTLGWGTSSQFVMNVGVYKSLPFNVEKDLRQIVLAIKVPLVMLAGNKVPPTLKEFVALAKTDPNKFNYGSAGNGSVSHVMSELLLKQAGITVQHIPYRGIAPALQDIAAGNVDFVFDTLIATRPIVDQGSGRLYGIGSDKRIESAPGVPTFAEQGFPEFHAYSWNSVFGPANIPPATMARLNAVINEAMRSTAFQARVKQVGGELLGGTSEEAEQFAARERARWIPFIRAQNITTE